MHLCRPAIFVTSVYDMSKCTRSGMRATTAISSMRLCDIISREIWTQSHRAEMSYVFVPVMFKYCRDAHGEREVMWNMRQPRAVMSVRWLLAAIWAGTVSMYVLLILSVLSLRQCGRAVKWRTRVPATSK